MQKKDLVVLATLIALASCAAYGQQPLDIKPGLWETNVTVKSNGNLQTFTNQGCVTKEAPEKAFINQDKNCTRNVVSSSSRREEVKMQCSVYGMTTNGTIEVEAIDAEHVKGSSRVVSSGKSGAIVNTEFAGHYVSASCGGKK